MISRPYFLLSSRFIERKNISLAIKSYSLYIERMIQQGCYNQIWGLIIIGDGDERERLEQLINDLGVTEVTLAGTRNYYELPAYYGLASAFIHPALQEQWGLVVNEAMASGLPVLISGSSGCASNLVEYGVNGYTFNPQSIEELANRMHEMSTGVHDLQEMGNASLRIIRKWGSDRYANGLFQAVNTTLK